MGLEQELFKQQLSGEIDKRIFVALLEDNTRRIMVDEELRLIIPLLSYQRDGTSPFFGRDLVQLPGFEYDNSRGVRMGISLRNKPFMDIISTETFQIYDDWSIYAKYRKNIGFGGWTEMGPNRSLKKIYSCFSPIGKYGDGGFIRMTREGGEVIETPLAANTDEKKQPTYILDVTRVRKLEYIHPSFDTEGETDCVSIPKMLGVSIDMFTKGGRLVKFPADWYF